MAHIQIQNVTKLLTLGRTVEPQVILLVVLAGVGQQLVDAPILEGDLLDQHWVYITRRRTHLETCLVVFEQTSAFVVVFLSSSEVLCPCK